ncbi:MAG: hypothetical protein ACOC40_02740 [Thermoplasmatota archaeon]
MKQILTNNSIIVQEAKKSFLSEEAAEGDTEIKVDSQKGFDTGQILLIGELGNETTEFAYTHDSTSPSDKTITLKDSLDYSHSQGTSVYIVPWDEYVFYHAPEKDSDKEKLATLKIQVDDEDTVYVDTSYSDGFYFTRLRNSVDEILSDYSDPIPWKGYDGNTVARCINYALKRNKMDSFTKFIDFDFCIDEINDAINYINGKKKKWSNLQDFNYKLGTMTRGENEFSLPDNVWDYSYKSILDVRVGDGKSLIYKDKREWNDLMVGVVRTEVESISEDTSITVENATELDDGGTVMIAGEQIDYDGKSGNTLTGIDDTSSISVGDSVWQGDYQEGNPLYYTVYGENLYVYPLTSSTDENKTVFVDFWTEAPEVNSYSDTLDVDRYDMVKHYLTWAIRMEIKNDGVRDTEDGDYLQFRDILVDAIRGDITGQHYMEKPELNTINYKSL